MEEPIAISALVLLIVKELFSYLKSHNANERRKPASEEIENALRVLILPIMRQQTNILEELKELASQGHDSHIHVQNGINALISGQDKMGVNLHNINNKLHGRSQ